MHYWVLFGKIPSNGLKWATLDFERPITVTASRRCSTSVIRRRPAPPGEELQTDPEMRTLSHLVRDGFLDVGNVLDAAETILWANVRRLYSVPV